MADQLKQLLEFLHEAEKLKTLLRHSWLSSGRQESVAEHSWRVALLAMILATKIEDKVNLEKVLKMIIIHDLGEIHAGDHHAWKGKLKNKYSLERKGLLKLMNKLPNEQKKQILNLWEEYEARKTKEAKFAKAVDKLEAITQHNEADIKTWVKEEYAYQLVHGAEESRYSSTLNTFKKLINEESSKKIQKAAKSKIK